MASTIIGLGYVGLTLSLKLADLGEMIYAIERKQEVVDSLLAGKPHISEPGLEGYLGKYLGKRFFPSTEPPQAGLASTHILCVNTPMGTSGKPDLSPLREAAVKLSSYISKGDLAVVRSTVPPGATRSVVLPEIEKGSGFMCGADFHLCVAPERTMEGKAISELGKLPQVIGGFNRTSSRLAAQFFGRITSKIRTVSSMEAAELTKLLDNSYRYTAFAIGNEFGLACEALGLDSHEVIEAANWEYPRNDIRLPGAGVGGGCLPKDSSMLADAMKEAGVSPKILLAAREINEGMPREILDRVIDFHRTHLIPPEESKILILGFAFKGRPEVNDTRHSPGGHLSKMLIDQGFNVQGYDPAVVSDKIRQFGAVPCRTVEEGFENATCVVTMNDNPRWSDLDLGKLSALQTNSSLIIDGWKVLNENKIKEKGVLFRRLGDGRGETDQ